MAPPPQLVADQAGALAAMLGGLDAASAQALDFYRIPLFLLPIYQAAATQYDVPWPILAAINEIETDYGTDLSVSSAGAEGWMQFEPGTWLQYGVDALNAGYADPYNPVDAIFAAARYLNAAGAAHNLSARDPRLQPLRSEYVELGAAAREADRRLSRPGDRHADRPRRRAPAGDRQAHRLGAPPTDGAADALGSATAGATAAQTAASAPATPASAAATPARGPGRLCADAARLPGGPPPSAATHDRASGPAAGGHHERTERARPWRCRTDGSSSSATRASSAST